MSWMVVNPEDTAACLTTEREMSDGEPGTRFVAFALRRQGPCSIEPLPDGTFRVTAADGAAAVGPLVGALADLTLRTAA